MSNIGTVSQLMRYPVKSMGGEKMNTATLGAQGILGDRGWAVRDELAKCIRGAKKFPELMQCKSRYPTEPTAEKAGPAEIIFPDGTTVISDTPEAPGQLSRFLEREVTLWPLQPADKLEHYLRGAPDNPDMVEELRAIFGLEPNESLPDLSKFPPEIMQYESPPGTYFDAFPLLVMTESSLAHMQAFVPDAMIDVRRFRP
ncbi:MAG: MOSC N-terminal beta barrel domain-containing protein [Pseudomonadota bacterium]